MPDGGKKAIIKKTDGNCTKVIALTRLTEKRMSEIRELEAVCRAYDRTEAEAELTNEMNYSRRLRCFFISYEHDRPAGFLSVFCPDGENAEIAAFVEPEKRRCGIFKSLFEAAEKELKMNGIGSVWAVAEPVSETAAAVAEAMKLDKKYSELVMELQPKEERGPSFRAKTGNDPFDPVKKKKKDDISSVCIHEPSIICDGGLDAAGYRFFDGNEEVGHAGVFAGSEELFIYDVEITDKYRGRGYGKAFTEKLLDLLRENNPGKRIKLQVRSDNIPAMKIYESCGFKIISQRDYYTGRKL